MERSTRPGSPELDVRLGGVWRDHHRYLLNVAFRVLGSVSEAEDVVQEGFARLVDVDLDEIDDVRGWLVVVVSRLCFDQLKSARHKRWSPITLEPEERPAVELGPADRVTLDDEVRLALHVVMARLTPAERTAFVLHDVFQYSFDDVATVVGRSAAACRQLATRARKHLSDESEAPRFAVETAEQRQVTDAFVAATSTGDLDGLLGVLDPDVTGDGDVGRRVTGRNAVARRTLHFLGPDSSATLLSLPTGDEPTVIALADGRVVAALRLTVRSGRITELHGVFDPANLADLNLTLYP